MATRKTTKRNNREGEIRLKFTKWHGEIPLMTQKKANRPSNRKVITKGVVSGFDFNEIAKAEDAAVLTRILDFVRAGYEYRMVDENGEEALRFIPIVEKDMKTVTLVAQTMGLFRKALDYKEVKPFYRGKEISRAKASKLVTEAQKEDAEYKQRVNVTPDTTVECPFCGTTFRVGKKLG